jgi:hypothetical protein
MRVIGKPMTAERLGWILSVIICISPDTLSSDVARQEAERVLRIVRTEQLELF